MIKFKNKHYIFPVVSVAMSLVLLSSFNSPVSAASNNEPVSSAISSDINNQEKLDPNDYTLTDEDGNILDSSEFDAYITTVPKSNSGDDGIATYDLHRVYKKVTLERRNYGSPILYRSIRYYYQEPGYASAWQGDVPLVRTYTNTGITGIPWYISVFSGPVSATKF